MAKMLHLLLDWEYPHWMMLAGAILVAAGFIGLAFHRNRNGPVNESSRARESTNGTAKGYAGIRIRIGWRAAEGEGEMTDEDESSGPGIIAAAERAILKFLRDREANEAAPEDRGTSTVNQLAQHPASASLVKQKKTIEELAAMIHQDLSNIGDAQSAVLT